MSKSGGSPGELSIAKGRSRFDQLRTANFLVSTGGQMSRDKFASVVKILLRMWQDRRPYDETLHALNQ